MPYCKALYNHLFVDVQGYYSPCCFYTEKKQYHYTDMSWKDFHKSEYMERIRDNMKTGWDEGCNDCKQLEDQNLPSYRNVVDGYCKSDIPKIEFIEISCNNSCNIRCRMCNQNFSSKWAETLNIEVSGIKNFEKFLSEIDTTDLKIVKYLGGEPFITPEIKILFDWMLALPNPVKFYCNTNLTLFPNKYLDTLKSFEKVIIGYSIERTELVNDYIRQDSKWDIVKTNLEKWEDFKRECNIDSYVHTTVQAYNFHNLKKIKTFCDEYSLFHSAFKIFGPDEFTLNSLPPDYINTYTDDYNIKFLNDYKYDQTLHTKLKETTEKQDKLLKNKLQDYIPEMNNGIWTKSFRPLREPS